MRVGTSYPSPVPFADAFSVCLNFVTQSSERLRPMSLDAGVKFSPLEAMHTGTIHRKLLLRLTAMCASKEPQSKHRRAEVADSSSSWGQSPPHPALGGRRGPCGVRGSGALKQRKQEHPQLLQGPWEVNSQAPAWPLCLRSSQERGRLHWGMRGLRKERE